MENKTLGDDYWSNRYLDQQTGWDIGYSSTPLSSFAATIEDKNAVILIPGCGNAYEVDDLLSKGFTNITVVDISSVLVKRLQEKFAGKPVKVIHADFFEHNGQYDFIFEQTFFCALNPSLRERYVTKMNELLKPGGQLVGVMFNRVFEEDGPPFGGTKEEYEQRFSPFFDIKKMELCYNSILPREGNELFVRLQKPV